MNAGLQKIEDTVKDMKEMSPAERMVSLGQLLGNLFLGDDGDGDVGNDCWWSEADWAANWLTKTVGMSWLDVDDLRRWAGVLNINSHAFGSAAGGVSGDTHVGKRRNSQKAARNTPVSRGGISLP